MLDRFSVEPCLHQLLLPGIVRPEKLLQERKNSGYAALNGDRNRSRKFLRQFFGTEKKKGAAFFRGGRKESRSVLLCRERPGAQWLRSLSDKEQAAPVCRRAAGFPVQEPKKRCLVYKREMRGRASSYHPPCACHIVKIHKNLLRNE